MSGIGKMHYSKSGYRASCDGNGRLKYPCKTTEKAKVTCGRCLRMIAANDRARLVTTMETDPETIPREDLDELDRWVFDDPWNDPEVQ